MILEVGAGLTVQLTPAEAKGVIPRIKALIKEKMGQKEQELQRISKLQRGFEENYEKLRTTIDPLINSLAC